jgi:hypothetical protein
MFYDPVRDLDRRAGVTLATHTGPQEPWGRCVRGQSSFATMRISIERGIPAHEARCVLSRELVRLERGPVRWSHLEREEVAIALTVAKRLVRPQLFAELMRTPGGPTAAQMYDALGVDLEHFHFYRRWRATGPDPEEVRTAPLDPVDVEWPPRWQRIAEAWTE